MLELLGLPPLADARQAEAVGAVGKDSKPEQRMIRVGYGQANLSDVPCLPLGLVKDSLHADAAGLLLTPCHREAELHVPLVLLQAFRQVAAPLVQVGRVQHLRVLERDECLKHK